MLTPSLLPCADNIASLGDGYFISMTQDEALQFIEDVHSLRVVLFSSLLQDAYEAFATGGGTTGSAIGALSGLDAASRVLTSGTVSAAGIATRKTYSSRPVPLDGEFDPEFVRTKICGWAPIFRFGGNGAGLQLSFFHVERQVGLYFPKIDIVMANGSTSDRTGFIVGKIDFDELGSIPIYNTSICFIEGSINIEHLYIDITLSSALVRPSEQFSVSIPKDSSIFRDVKEIFLGRFPLAFQKGESSITLTAPSSAVKDRLFFRAIDEVGGENLFFSPYPVTVKP